MENIAVNLPGKQLTLDVWRQMEGKGKNRLHFDYRTGMNCMALAKHVPDEIKTIAEAQKCEQMLMKLLGIETTRGDETARLKPDEWGRLTHWFSDFDPAKELQALKSNVNYFPDGHLRPDLRAAYAAEWGPKFAALDELRRELGL